MSNEHIQAAFPTPGRTEQRPVHPPATGTYAHNIAPKEGMTLRDYFAAQAITGAAADLTGPMEQEAVDVMARNAYAVAEAMLRARDI